MQSLNSLPYDTFLDLSKFREFAEDTINVPKKVKYDLGKVEKIV